MFTIFIYTYISAYKVSVIDRLKNISDFWPSTPITQPLQTQSFPGWWHFRGFAIYAPHLILDHVCSCPPPPPPPAVFISYNTREWIVKCGELGELEKWKWSATTEQSSCQSGPHSGDCSWGHIKFPCPCPCPVPLSRPKPDPMIFCWRWLTLLEFISLPEKCFMSAIRKCARLNCTIDK